MLSQEQLQAVSCKCSEMKAGCILTSCKEHGSRQFLYRDFEVQYLAHTFLDMLFNLKKLFARVHKHRHV